jgi:2,4-dienoyl-CoA reductase-like NADH-dependent reductase (Old Yellow Enzyme family)
MSYPSPLFNPLSLGSVRLKNRLAMAGHVTNLSEGPGLSDRHLAYLCARIDGGLGLVVNDPVSVHPSSATLRTTLALQQDELDQYPAMIACCRRAGVAALQQLVHAGAQGCAVTAFAAAWSPSGLPSLRDQDGSHAMSDGEVETLIEAFVDHALMADAIGFDGVEIVAGGNMLLEQFWSERSNRRDDRWGGDFERRMGFSTEVVQRIRAALGANFVVGMVMTSDQGYDNQLAPQELEKILRWHESVGGVDYYSFSLSSPEPTAQELQQLRAYRGSLNKGLLRIAGNVLDIDVAEQLLHHEAADWIGMDRALMADPMLPDKLMRGELEAVRPCVDCKQCVGRRARDYAISCLANPCVGREQEFAASMPAAKTAQKLLIVGGGLAGLEAARGAAEAGYQVALVEKSNQLGGAWRLAARQPERARLGKLIDWYQYQLKELGVQPRLGESVDEALLDREVFDALIIATGSLPGSTGFQRRMPNHSSLPGIDSGNVFSVEQVLDDSAVLAQAPSATVLLLDDIGHWQGVGTALYLAQQGYQVTLLSRHSMPAPELMALGGYDRLLEQLQNQGVNWISDAMLLSWQGGEAEIFALGDPASRRQYFDALVLATTPEADQALERSAAARGVPYYLAGDCQGARKAHMAIFEGRKAVMTVSQVGAQESVFHQQESHSC